MANSKTFFRNCSEVLNDVQTAALTHVDYHLGNLLFSGSSITAVLDFEWCFAGDPLYDFCHWLSNNEDWPGSLEPFRKGANRAEFTESENQRLRIYQIVRNVEMCAVAKMHFEKVEADDYVAATLKYLEVLEGRLI